MEVFTGDGGFCRRWRFLQEMDDDIQYREPLAFCPRRIEVLKRRSGVRFETIF